MHVNRFSVNGHQWKAALLVPNAQSSRKSPVSNYEYINSWMDDRSVHTSWTCIDALYTWSWWMLENFIASLLEPAWTNWDLRMNYFDGKVMTDQTRSRQIKTHEKYVLTVSTQPKKKKRMKEDIYRGRVCCAVIHNEGWTTMCGGLAAFGGFRDATAAPPPPLPTPPTPSVTDGWSNLKCKYYHASWISVMTQLPTIIYSE